MINKFIAANDEFSYSDDKFYFAKSICGGRICKLVKTNKYVWVSFDADNRNPQSSWYFKSISESISAYQDLTYTVKEFDTFEEAMKYYYPDNWKSKKQK